MHIRLSDTSLTVLQLTMLVVLTAVAYSSVKDHEFVWDTIPFVIENPWIHEWSLTNTVSILTEAHRANWHPLVLFSHAIDFSLFGYDSGAHHIMNVLYHIANGSLIYWLVFKLLPKSQPHQIRLWIAWLTAVIFCIHPQHVESVAWVVERKDVLYTLFWLLSVLCYLRANVGWQRTLPFIMFLLALSAKPMAVTLPVVLLMIDVYRGRIDSITTFVKATAEKAPYFAASLAVVVITLNTQSIAMPSIDQLPLWARALNAINNIWFYVGHYLWPTQLSPFYPYPVNASTILSPWFWLPGAGFTIALITIGLICWRYGAKWPLLLVLFYLVTLAPVSGLIHVGPAKATDHYVYLATLPFSFLTALGVTYGWRRWLRLRTLTATLAAMYVLLLLSTAQVQTSYWQNPLTLWWRVTNLYPDSAFAHRNLAAAYLSVGDYELALHHGEMSLDLGSPDKAFVAQLRSLVASDDE
jgi:hypothetical protein